MKEGMQNTFCKIIILIERSLIMPASNPSFWRFFGPLPRIKSEMQSRMSQERLNHLMVWSVNKNDLNQLNLMDVQNEFYAEPETRKSKYGTFVESHIV